MEQGKPFSATESPPLVDFDAVCQKVRAAVEPARAHAVSLHDEHGDVLWLSESSMGPDEHNAVREALDAFSKGGPPVLAYDLGDARSAVLIRAVNGRRALVGAIMVIMDTRMIKQDERGAVKMMTPRLQRALADFAAMRPDTAPPPLERAPSPPPAVSPVKSASLTSIKASAPKGGLPEIKAAVAPMSTRPAPPARATPQSSAPPGAPASAPRPAPAPAPASARAPAPARAPAAAREPAPVRGEAYGREASPIELELAEALPREHEMRSSPAEAPAPPAPAPAARAPSAHTPSARAASAPAPPAPAPAAPAHPPAAPQVQPAGQITPQIDRLNAAMRRSPIALHVQHLVPLSKGSQLKRYEVLLRSKSEDAPNAAPQAMLRAAVDNGLGSMIDRRVVTELVGWLVHHPDVWQSNPVMFSVNLTTTALHDEHFIKFVELCLLKSSLPVATIAFEIDVPTACKLTARVSEVASALSRLGCPIVLDDFALRTECFDLLRLPGVRYIKLASEITAKMRTDKLSQAAITAVVQMARVLGMHTVAKRTETSTEQEWLTALGVDFVQSHALSPPVLISTLSRATRSEPRRS